MTVLDCSKMWKKNCLKSLFDVFTISKHKQLIALVTYTYMEGLT